MIYFTLSDQLVTMRISQKSFIILLAVCLIPAAVQAEKSTILTFMPAILAGSSQVLDSNALYVSPGGSGTSCSRSTPCQLTTARDAIRSLNRGGGMSEDITVYLRQETYNLTSAFQLTTEDSGTNGYTVHYKGFPGEKPVISGGFSISGWTLYDSSENIYRARTVSGVNFRQLYVDGKRAVRARGESNPTGFVRSGSGFNSIDSAMQGWSNRSDIEIVGFNEWRSFRCQVADIVGTAMRLQEPCWSNATGSFQPDNGFDRVTWVENAYELLDSEREWYLDRSTTYLYYKPGSGEHPPSASFIYPRLQTLVQVSGTDGSPVRNISLSGITFAYTTWLTPSSATGYADLQAGFHFTGSSGNLQKTPAAVQVEHGAGISFNNNTFVHLGGAGLNIAGGSSNVSVTGNRFEDISSTAVQLGDINLDRTTANNTISNNVVIRAGQEYHGAVGIFVGYAKSTAIERNELRDLPYSGISVGWGWGTSSYAASNRIRYNWIENIMQVLRDGGAVYTLSPQTGSEISYNYVCRQVNDHGAIYADEGTSGYYIHHNVLSHIGESWLFNHNADYNTVEYNFSDNMYAVDQGVGNTIGNTTFVQAGNWPAEAGSIMNGAGVSSGYQGSGEKSFCRSGATILFVEDDTDPQQSWSRIGYDDALFNLNIPYDIWDTGSGNTEPDSSTLGRYDTVIWSTGYAEINDADITGAAQDGLKSWLDSGGDKRLLMSSHMYHALNWNSSLMRAYFELDMSSSYIDTSSLTGQGRLAGYGPYILAPNVSRGNDTLTLNPDSSESILRMNGHTAGTTRDSGYYQATYLAFPFAAINSSADRTELLGRILSW